MRSTTPDEPCFAVVDALEDFFEIARRSQTLDGSAPLRAVQGCPPFLEGNAYGFQLRFAGLGLELTRSGGALRLTMLDELSEEFDYAAVVRRSLAVGLLRREDPSYDGLSKGFSWPSADGASVHVWTGHFVRPADGVALRLTGALNRGNASVRVREALFSDPTRFVPLVLEVSLHPRADRALLVGDVACLGPVRRDLELSFSRLPDHPEVGQEVVDFYSPSYFDEKTEGQTGRRHRYRDRVGSSKARGDGAAAPAPAGPLARVVSLGPSLTGFFGEEGDAARHLAIRSPCELRITPDGAAFQHELRGFEAGSSELASVWRGLYGEAGLEAIRSVLLAMFVDLAQGENLFQWIPPVLVRTAPGWSCLIDGLDGDEYLGLRGVVWTDVYPLVPSAFSPHDRLRAFVVGEGTPMARVYPVPRSLLAQGFRAESLDAFERREGPRAEPLEGPRAEPLEEPEPRGA